MVCIEGMPVCDLLFIFLFLRGRTLLLPFSIFLRWHVICRGINVWFMVCIVIFDWYFWLNLYVFLFWGVHSCVCHCYCRNLSIQISKSITHQKHETWTHTHTRQIVRRNTKQTNHAKIQNIRTKQTLCVCMPVVPSPSLYFTWMGLLLWDWLSTIDIFPW